MTLDRAAATRPLKSTPLPLFHLGEPLTGCRRLGVVARIHAIGDEGDVVRASDVCVGPDSQHPGPPLLATGGKPLFQRVIGGPKVQDVVSARRPIDDRSRRLSRERCCEDRRVVTISFRMERNHL